MSERNPGNATRASFLSGPSSSASAIAQHYDAIVAERYDSETQGSRVIHACREMALDQIRSRPELDVGSVLDLGTGTGSLLAELHEMFPGAELVGVDSSEGMLAIARRKFGDGPVRWIRDDLENAGRHLPSESFDLVSLHFVLAYVDHEKAVHAARDALKPGGTLSLVTCTSDSFRTCMKYALRHYPEVADVVPSSHEGAVELLTSAGFSVIRGARLRVRFSLPRFRRALPFRARRGLVYDALHDGFVSMDPLHVQDDLTPRIPARRRAPRLDSLM